MRLNASLGIDFTNWTEPQLEREYNGVQLRNLNKEMPESGKNSEYGREDYHNFFMRHKVYCISNGIL